MMAAASDTQALMAEYERLWQEFRDGPHRVGPDIPPRQVCFDIARVESELKAAGVADPFALVRKDYDAIEFIASIDISESVQVEDTPTLDDAPTLPPAASPRQSKPVQLGLF